MKRDSQFEELSSSRFISSSQKPKYLMCPPTLYEVSYVINPWMQGNLGNSSRLRAMGQWEELYAAVSKIANVELVEPVMGSPDMVFTANAGLARDGVVAISSFYHPERQGEEEHFRRWFERAGYVVVDLPRETPFEGEGDALFTVDDTRLWVGYGTRTLESSHAALRGLWAVDVVGLCLVDPRFYHLDTCFAPLEDGSVMYYPAAFDAASREKIEAFYPEDKRIVVGENDALAFACNAVNVGRTIVLNRISAELEQELRERGFEVVQVLLDEFLKAGGAAKCLVMKLTSELHPTRGDEEGAARKKKSEAELIALELLFGGWSVRRKLPLSRIAAMSLALLGAITLLLPVSGCGNNAPPPTASEAETVTVTLIGTPDGATATVPASGAGNVTQTFTFTLNVQ